ncbi:MAG: 6-carboxytetrahydropterin synthase QueD, partial [Candidatus Omnitrophica bacterium]|nr:6-carboxytetrahydropterin synthase QueD [Candidatus Omnitrophota bacterium]
YQGKCEALHGHNWKVKATVEGKKLAKNGMLLDFGELKKKLKEVLEELDHKNLNEIEYFKKNNPTSENIARFIFDRLSNRLKETSSRLKKVTVWETDTSSASYYEE